MKAIVTIFAGLIAFATSAQAHEYKLGPLQIVHPWARATPAGARVGGGYMKIINNGPEADRLISGSSPIAGRFEVHEMKIEDGVMKMRLLKEGLEIKPGETVELKPGSFHVMLQDLKGAMKAGERVKGTLVFEKAGTVDVEYAVGPIGSTPSGHDGAAQGDHQNH